MLVDWIAAWIVNIGRAFARSMGRETEPRPRFDLMAIPKFNYRCFSDWSWASKQVPGPG
jgi:hypothetical protein